MYKRENFQKEVVDVTQFLRNEFGIDPKHKVLKVVVLGTGFGDTLMLQCQKRIPFTEIPGFSQFDELEGHDRCFCHGYLDGKEVLTVARIHMNESSYNPDLIKMIRILTEVPIELGMRKYFVTAAVGSLNPDIHVGDLVAVDSFLSLFAPDMNMAFTGEFTNPEDAISKRLIDVAKFLKEYYGREIKTGTHAMIRGPWFEGRKVDKIALRNNGADVVGMSIYPEVGIASLYKNVEVLPLCFVTNSISDEMSHEAHQKEASMMSVSLGSFMRELIKLS